MHQGYRLLQVCQAPQIQSKSEYLFFYKTLLECAEKVYKSADMYLRKPAFMFHYANCSFFIYGETAGGIIEHYI